MEYATPEEIAAIVAAAGDGVQKAPGGAAANTTAGVSALGVPSAFVGSAAMMITVNYLAIAWWPVVVSRVCKAANWPPAMY